MTCFTPNETTTVGVSGQASEEGYHVSHVHPDGGTGAAYRVEFWTDAEGVPVTARRTVLYADSQPEDVTHITFSGIGEPNVITAPVVE